MNTILCIIRTSTLQQELDSQHSEMETFCHSLGYKNIRYLEAKGASARSLNKAYLQLLEEIKTTIINDNTINAVGLWHLNRLGRKEIKLVEMKTWFIQHNINVYVKNPSLTLFNSDGTLNQMTSMFWNMLSVSIEIDTEELMAKTKRGKIHNKEIGKWNGGAFGTLFGYKVDTEGYVKVDDTEAITVKHIFNAYASGLYSYTTLAKELRERGITHRGKKITDIFIKKILSDVRYTGTEKRFDRIVQPDIYDKTRQIAVSNTAGEQDKSTKRILMAIKILKCRHCGRYYMANSKSYQCYGKMKAQRLDTPCKTSETIAINVMDKVLIHAAKLLHIDYLSQIDQQALHMEQDKLSTLVEKQHTAETEINRLNDNISRLTELYVEGQITRQQYDDKSDNVRERQKALKQARQAYISEQVSVGLRIHAIQHPSPEAFISLFNDIDDINNRQQLKDIVRQHITEAYIQRVTRDGKQCIDITLHTDKNTTITYAYFFNAYADSPKLYEIDRQGNLIVLS